MTTDGLMRHPAFKGMREDKKVKEVVLEIAADTDEVIPKSINPKDMLIIKEEETQLKKVNGQELTFSNLDKIYWPVEKISKRDLINYYDQISAFILPYLKDRPQSLSRYPNGITGQSFYQKDVTGKVPDWIKTYLYHAEGDDTDKHFLVGADKATLLYMANLGCIEIHPWSSTIKKPDHPTWCILDLDPDKQRFDQTIEVAQVTKAILDDMGVPGYCKTSGSTGLHIYIPLGNKYTYDQSKELAKIIVTLVNRELPKTTSIERVVADRKGKIYLDFLQNRTQATIAAPYSLRPKPGASVSMPLHWDEVKKGLQMKDFNIYNAISRVNEMGDLFKPVLGKGINLATVIKKKTAYLNNLVMRSIWKGAIGFGLVNIPVKLFSGVTSSNLDLDMLDERDHSNIKFKRVNEKTHKEVPFENIVKGYFLKDRYIVLDDHDFDEVKPEKTKIIEIENFVDIREINAIYYETSYYTQPETQGKKAYALLLQALLKSKKAGVARFVLRNQEHLCVIHPLDGIIVITKIRFQEEIRSTKEVQLKEEITIKPKELEVGLALIKQYSGSFNIASFKNDYSKELLKIIKSKAKGKRATVKKIKPQKAVSDDLYEQLLESLNKRA
jgi:Ku protein